MKVVKVLLLIASILIFSVVVCADELTSLVYQYSNPEATVTFSEYLDIPSERYQKIADDLIGITSMEPLEPEQPNGIICTLFGHNLTTTTVTVTHHKVRQYTPRCLMEVYHVSTCSRCDYYTQEMVNSFHISCCPED